MEKVIRRIKIHEGFRSKVYVDTVGKLTIGFGRNLSDKGINEEEAEMLLHNDLYEALEQFEKVQRDFDLHLDYIRRGICIEMIYWIGIGGFLKFKKMIRALQEYNFEKAADEMLDSKLNSQCPERTRKLSMMMRDS